MSIFKDFLGDAYKEGMTEDELSEALSKAGFKKPDNSELDKATAEIKKLKETLSKKNSEASEYKKQYEAHLSEEEKRKLDQEKKMADLEQENVQLKRDKAVAEFTSQFIGLGYEADLAKSTAEAMADGDVKTVMANHGAFAQAMEKKIRADVMRNNPDPVGGSGSSTMTLKDLRAMSIEQRYAFSQEHPEEYASLYEKEN